MATQRRTRPRPAKKTAPPAQRVDAPVEADEVVPATDTQEPADIDAADELDGVLDTDSTVPDAGPPTDDGESGTDDASDEGDDEDHEDAIYNSEFRTFWNEYVNDNGINLPEGHVLFPDEPLTFKGNTLRGSVVEVSEDIYRMVIPFRSKRPTFVLVARAGTIVPKAKFVTAEDYRTATQGALDVLLGE